MVIDNFSLLLTILAPVFDQIQLHGAQIQKHWMKSNRWKQVSVSVDLHLETFMRWRRSNIV